jgi:[ribosomal protein S5]-alanine N-acetyltransferase
MHRTPPASVSQIFRLATERLILRHFQITDREPMYQIFCDAEVMRFSDGIKTKEWVDAWLHSCLARYHTWDYGPYAVVEQCSQDVIGYCGLFFFEDVDGRPEIEIGYRFLHSTWGQGYATEAALAVRDYAFATLGIKRLIALIDPSNVASIRVAEKIGMQYEKDVMLNGYTHPDHVYVITAT